METPPGESNNGLLFANFNQDFGCFVAVFGRGFRIFNSDPLREKESRSFPATAAAANPFPAAASPPDASGGVDPPWTSEMAMTADATLEAVGKGLAKIVKAEMLFRCNYVALVIAPSVGGGAVSGGVAAGTHHAGGQQQQHILSQQQQQQAHANQGHKVVIWDDLKMRGIIQLEFNAEVRGVRLRRDRIVVVLKNMLKVYTFTASPQQLHVFDSASNWRGLCSLSPSSAKSLLAFPAPENDGLVPLPSGGDADDDRGSSPRSSTGPPAGQGTVKVVDLAHPDRAPLIVAAHASKLSCLTLNIQGTRLATASDKGTLIRIFDTESGNQLTELRRGSQHATIYSINFSPDSSLLVVSSSHGTIHVFSSEDPSKNKQSSLFSAASAMVGNLFGLGSSSSGSSNENSTKNPAEPPSSSSASASQPSGGTGGGSGHFGGKLVPKYFSSEWSFGRIEVPGATKCIVAFTGAPNTNSSGSTVPGYSSVGPNNFAVMAVCADGSYHKFAYDKKRESFTREVYHMFVEDGIDS